MCHFPEQFYQAKAADRDQHDLTSPLQVLHVLVSSFLRHCVLGLFYSREVSAGLVLFGFIVPCQPFHCQRWGTNNTEVSVWVSTKARPITLTKVNCPTQCSGMMTYILAISNIIKPKKDHPICVVWVSLCQFSDFWWIQDMPWNIRIPRIALKWPVMMKPSVGKLFWCYFSQFKQWTLPSLDFTVSASSHRLFL